MEQINIVRTNQELQELLDYLKDKDLIAFDTETTGVDKESEIIGYSVCADPLLGWYVILSYWDVTQQKLVYLDTKERTRELLIGLKGKDLVMHNAPFDCSMVETNFQVSLIDSVKVDTMILSHLVDENRSNALKELSVSLFGDDVVKEQKEMKESVSKNGGVLTKEKYELYKGDADLIAKYGAKDAILTLRVLYEEYPKLVEQNLEDFFFEESMLLLKGPTYQLNTVGLRVDPERLSLLKSQLETEILEARSFIYKEIQADVQVEYPGTNKTNGFNIDSGEQLAWLLFFKLGNVFNGLTKGGKELCKGLGLKTPYSNAAKREFIRAVQDNLDRVWQEAKWNPKKRKMGRPKKVGKPWKYISTGQETMDKLKDRYKWVQKLIEYKKNDKLLATYVLGIQSRTNHYNIIHPSFLQHGTTSGRYSSKNPNFQNLPREDKRVKACIVARPGKVFVGADHSQLEPRIFASQSQDERLMGCFESGEDFYSVVGAPIFDKEGKSTSLFKEVDGSFARRFPKERQLSKEDIALASVYGTTAYTMSKSTGLESEECQEIINTYFDSFPKVYQFMLDSHEQAKTTGAVYNLFGRPRRMPEAMKIPELFGNAHYLEIPYIWRNWLNLAVNHRVQSTAASLVNRNAIAFSRKAKELGIHDSLWKEVFLVVQTHDNLVVESPRSIATHVAEVLQDCMENSVTLPGVKLEAVPKIGLDLSQV